MSKSSDRRPYLFYFAQTHDDFRIPELLSIAELHDFEIELPYKVDTARPFMIAHLQSEEHVHLLAKRCILVKSIYELWAQGSSYDELHANNLAARPLWEKYIPDTSFKFVVESFGHSLDNKRQRELIESFSYMGFRGDIEMKNPQLVVGLFEEHHDRRKDGTPMAPEGNFREAFLGRLIAEGTARPLMHTFNVKKRLYYGNTSMEAEISLLMANQTLATPGKLIYDPFAGTGSMLYTAAFFGALVFGSDIDGRQMRGKDKIPGIRRAAAQYGVESRVTDLLTFDVTRNPWRCGGLFDAIVTDPPYGVRAGAKRLGRKDAKTKKDALQRPPPPAGGKSLHWVPQTKPYELSELAVDLVKLARFLLKPGGRLVFFLPTVTDEYDELDVESMLCEGMELVANSLQDFGSWGRRLITLRKISDPRSVEEGREGTTTHVPAHKDFREKYFRSFRKLNEEEKEVSTSED